MAKEASSNNTELALAVVAVVALLGVGAFIFQGAPFQTTNELTGRAVDNTLSRVVIQNYVAIAKGGNLSDQIDFGTINIMPTSNINGTANYDPTNTGYYVSVSADSNIGVDFCIRANASLTNAGANTIPLANYTWADDTTNGAGNPAPFGIALTTSYVATSASTNVLPGNDNYYRFWLDVDAATSPGTYSISH
jgi:hypothetical protein